LSPTAAVGAPRGAAARVRPGLREDLSARVHRAVHMARRAVDAACAPPPARASGASEGPAPLYLVKVAGEAAMLMRIVDFLGDADAGLRAALAALAARLAPVARGDAVLAGLCRPPAGAIEHASAHVFLADLGLRDDAFDDLLAQLAGDALAVGPERLPNHDLERHWLMQIRSGAVRRRAADPALLARTCLAWPLDLLRCSTLDLYVFTHVVMYATDMGRRRARLPRPAREVAAEAEAALAAALDADNLDLAAELLWTWPMLRLPWPAVAVFAFELLAQAQDEHGFLPGPEHARWAGQARPGWRDDEIQLRTSYHATLVMGMTCGAALRAGGMRAEGAHRANGDPRAVDDLLRRLPPRPVRPRWERALEALPPGRRSALAPLALDAWLRRAAAAGDLAQVREALAAGVACGCETAAMHQALALLRRSMAVARRGGEGGGVRSSDLTPSSSCAP
jgi:hypothetical protein